MTSSPASARAITMEENAILQPALIMMSPGERSLTLPYTAFISPTSDCLRENSPAVGAYPHNLESDAALPNASRTKGGGGIPGTP